MKMMLIAGGMITFPAILLVFYFFGTTMMIPALASLAINSLPFLVAGWLLGNGKDEDGEADAH